VPQLRSDAADAGQCLKNHSWGFHASNEHNVLHELLFRECRPIVDNFVVNDLFDKADWLLSAVVIDYLHVDIINEQKQFLTNRGTLLLTETFLDV
jgi:hypothetical protein